MWSADGRRLAFTFASTSIHQKLATGEAEDELLSVRQLVKPTDWSADGRFLLWHASADANNRWALWVARSGLLPRANQGAEPPPKNEQEAVPLARTGGAFDEEQGRFSPDGRWIAYVSNATGANEVYVRSFITDFSGGTATRGGSVLVSRGGGTSPRWRRDGTELFYLAANGKMMAVAVDATHEFQPRAPVPLFTVPPGAVVGDAAADGARFLLVTPVGLSASAPFTVVLNWVAGLKQ